MIDKGVFLKGLLPERDVEVAAGVARIRGLSRLEQVELQPYSTDVAELECRILAAGLIDPPLTLDDARAYYAVAQAGEVEQLVAAIGELSAATKEAAKSGVPGIRAEPGS